MKHPLFELLGESGVPAAQSSPGGQTMAAWSKAADAATVATAMEHVATVEARLTAAAAAAPTTRSVQIVAVQDPPWPDGSPGAITFAPDLTLAERRELLMDFKFFEMADRRQKHSQANTQHS